MSSTQLALQGGVLQSQKGIDMQCRPVHVTRTESTHVYTRTDRGQRGHNRAPSSPSNTQSLSTQEFTADEQPSNHKALDLQSIGDWGKTLNSVVTELTRLTLHVEKSGCCLAHLGGLWRIGTVSLRREPSSVATLILTSLPKFPLPAHSRWQIEPQCHQNGRCMQI